MSGRECLKEAFFSKKKKKNCHELNASNFAIKSIMKIEDMKASELKCL